jgi:hypothetical protein
MKLYLEIRNIKPTYIDAGGWEFPKMYRLTHYTVEFGLYEPDSLCGHEVLGGMVEIKNLSTDEIIEKVSSLIKNEVVLL